MIQEIKTYEDLLKVLKELNPEQLKQKVQVVQSTPIENEMLLLLPVYAMGTVSLLGNPTRSSVNNLHNPDELTLMMDYFPYDDKGRSFKEMELM